MNFINKLKLGQKLILLASVPLIIMIGFAVVRSISSFSLYTTMVQIESMTELGIYSSSLVHELQKERGMTAGFLGSKGAKFGEKIKQQRQLTNEKIAELNHFLKEFDAASVSKKVDSGITDALKRLSLIKQTRSAVNKQSIQLKDAIAYYTNLNASFLGLISDISMNSSNGELAVMTAAYANYLQAKERAGIERAVLANVFSRDNFGPLFNKFLSLVAAQDNYSNVFLSLAKEEDKIFYKDTLQGASVDEVNRLRQIAREKSLDGGFGVEGTYWFEVATGRINLLKKMENYLSEKLSEKTEQLISESLNELIISLIIAVLGTLISMGLARTILRGIDEQLGGEPDYIEKIASSIADGCLDMKLENKVGSPTGVYAAMLVMQKKLSDVIEKDIQIIVDAARNGDLEQRVDLQDKNGFYKSLGSGINDIVEASDNVISDTVRVFGALAKGDLSETITRDYHGSFDQLKQDANSTIDKIRNVIEIDVQSIVNSAQAGNLAGQIDLEDKYGFFLELSSSINQLIATIDDIFKDISQEMEAISNGDLTRTMDNNYSGGFAKIQSLFNATSSNLLGIVSEIRSASSQISSAANEISQGNTDLSQRTEEQAASLEETASSMEELTSTVKQNADNSRQANQLAVGARDQAQDGGKVIESTILAMQEISNSSKRIEDIIGVIDEIAFQTNLLALNAAVEAARAGEQGKGFAVVASEVRNLAQRSAAAAKEIKSLIKDSVENVDEGTRLVDESGITLADIVNSVRKVSDIIAEIAASSGEQSSGIEQINQAITQLDEVTQQNAALVEEAAAASESMDERAKSMNEMMSFFNTGNIDIAAVEINQISYQSPEQAKKILEIAPANDKNVPEKIVVSASVAMADSAWEEF